MNDLTDFHTHILPDFDDGSRSEEESLAMLRQEWQDGVRRVVLTPHFYPWRDTPERFLEQRAHAMERLQQAAAGEAELPALYLGAEVAYFRGMSESEALKALTVNGSRYILVEPPVGPWNAQVYEELEQIHAKQGLIPIVAHIDRYISRLTVRRIISRMMELPVILQANAGAFLRRGEAAMLLRLAASGAVRLLGSDCHDLTERAPNLGQAAQVICQKLGSSRLEDMDTFGQSLLNK